MVYTDGVHLVAESLAELCSYAQKIGLNQEWLQIMGRKIHPHLDICGKVRQRVLADSNVKKVSPKEIVKICKLNYRVPETPEEVIEWENHHNKKMEDVPMPTERDFDRMFSNIMKRVGLQTS